MVILYHKYGCWDMYHYIVIGANKKLRMPTDSNWQIATSFSQFQRCVELKSVKRFSSTKLIVEFASFYSIPSLKQHNQTLN